MIGVAILGAGIGAEHLAALRTLPDCFDVRRIIDRDLLRARSLCAGPACTVSADIADALTDPSIDLIDICLPPHLHVAVTLQALAAGKHVVCEKPIATSLEDVARIEDAARAAARRVFPVFQYRWGPSLSKLRALMASGLTGALHSAALETHWNRGTDYYAAPWRGTWEGERGGAVLGHAIHNHDLLCHIGGDVASVMAMTTTRINDIETEDCAAISLEMASGALCTSSITLGAATNETRLRLVFERLTATSGTAPYDPGSVPWRFVARDLCDQAAIDSVTTKVHAERTGFAGFFEQVAHALAGQQNTAVTLDAGAQSIALVTAIYHAARTGERVTLPLPADHPLSKGWLP
ncbi:Gfo/Idh/MocA family oxidoreductase [Sulfitobacter albidus]|uniref:Gfo/Idh/MocA family oxidoreductase n=1 Tax=Sulfitobacter albidus TaxID=2829501 RepID=A0A975JGS1_9RHOB|nr:Gfo/Idh/MocA family oxidoreductase [Sulfitobacter albidus]QUJ78173.1 Gfo/Idh/MocA family oxidoreductase [Sulfitobacter albidus]